MEEELAHFHEMGSCVCAVGAHCTVSHTALQPTWWHGGIKVENCANTISLERAPRGGTIISNMGVGSLVLI